MSQQTRTPPSHPTFHSASAFLLAKEKPTFISPRSMNDHPPPGYVKRPVITLLIVTTTMVVVILWKLLHDLDITRP